MKIVYLNQFQETKPLHSVKQDEVLAWIISAHQLAELKAHSNSEVANPIPAETIERLFQRFAVKNSQISNRYFECPDILKNDFLTNKIYRIDDQNCSGVNIAERAAFFSDRAFAVMKEFYNSESKRYRPDHLIHVSCTGYVSPSAAQKIVISDHWNYPTEVTHAYHMGCYAALPAVRLAKGLVLSSENLDFKTDIVHSEMCGLHMNPAVHTPEQMVVQSLFADGHIKYTCSTQKNKNESENSLKVVAILERIVPDSQQDMSWSPTTWGMQMNLSREVPVKIKNELKKFANDLYEKAHLDLKTASNSIFAVHPGGPKIIDSVQEVLELSESQISESRKVLFERGNMSSATLPHVWMEILSRNYSTGTKVISFAFGPGLTLFGAVFEIC